MQISRIYRVSVGRYWHAAAERPTVSPASVGKPANIGLLISSSRHDMHEPDTRTDFLPSRHASTQTDRLKIMQDRKMKDLVRVHILNSDDI